MQRYGGYVLGAVVMVAGVVWFAVGLFVDIVGMGDDLQVLEGPGVFDVDLQQDGTWTVFHEHRTVVGNQAFDGPMPAGTALTVETKGGLEMGVHAASASSSYEMGGRAGRAVFEFDVHTPGPHVATIEAPGPVVFTLAHDFMGGIWSTILGSFARIGGGFLLGVVIIVITALRNDKKGTS